MANYLDRLAEDIVTQQNKLSRNPFTAGGAINPPSMGAMQMANMPQVGGMPPMMSAPRTMPQQGRMPPQGGMPPRPPQGQPPNPMATAMNRPAGAPRIPQTLRGGNEMTKSRQGYSNSFSGAMARRAQEKRGIEHEEQFAAEKKEMQLKAMDQRYNDFKQIYGKRYPTLDKATLDSAARLVALGQDPKDIFPQVATVDERFKQADTIRDDAKEMLKSFNKSQVQFSTLNRLAKSGWEGQGAGQVAALYTFIKELDPDSVVREGEVAMAKSAQSVLNQFKSVYSNVTENTLMSEDMFKDIINLTQDLNQIRQQSYRDEYLQHAERADEWQIPRDKVFGNTFNTMMASGVPAPTMMDRGETEAPEEAEDPMLSSPTQSMEELKARVEALKG